MGPFKAALATAGLKMTHSDVERQIVRLYLLTLIATACKSSVTIPYIQAAFMKTGYYLIFLLSVKWVLLKKIAKGRNQGRKENVRNTTFLLSEIGENGVNILQTRGAHCSEK